MTTATPRTTPSKITVEFRKFLNLFSASIGLKLNKAKYVTPKKCTKTFIFRQIKPSLWRGGVLVAVVVLVCLRP